MTDEAEMPSWERLRRCSEVPDPEYFGAPPEAMEAFNAGMAAWIHGDAHGFWEEPSAKDGHSDTNQFVTTLGERLAMLSSAYNGNPTQSPIEARLFGGLLWLSKDWAGFPDYNEFDDPATYQNEHGTEGLNFWITTQAKFDNYKADICLWFTMGKAKGGIVVECDGHAFHEKTKEQAARDKKRDRVILQAGFPVMRFSGSEIFNDTPGCIEQISDVLNDVLFRVSKAGGLF